MNKGKICVSVCAETALELVENIKQATAYADVIELRFDCLKSCEIKKAALNLPKINGAYLATFRPKTEGGKRDLTLRERLEFWQFFFYKIYKKGEFFVDFELDLQRVLQRKSNETIVSFHDFSGSDFSADRDALKAAFQVYRAVAGDAILKFAVQTDDVCDSIRVWNLGKQAARENIKIIPIAMGESGKWTRVLSLAHGAPFVYASLETGKETAAGQISARDLIETYRVKELDRETEVYGIVGNPVSHSLSPFMHNAAFRHHDLNAVYIPFQAKKFDDFAAKFIKKETREVELNLKGFSVTIPHKFAALKHLDFADEAAKKIGAANTLKIEDGKIYGFNTDWEGFIEPLKSVYGDLSGARVAVFGAGGAARACIYALTKENADATVFARDFPKAENLAREFGISAAKLKSETDSYDGFDVLVNATPLGTKGVSENETPAFRKQLKNAKLVYDLIYNPFETRLIKEAKAAGVPTIGGLAMLVGQAVKQFEIWTGKPAPLREMSAAALRRI